MDDFWQSIEDNTFNLAPPPHVSPHVGQSSGAINTALIQPSAAAPQQKQNEPEDDNTLASGGDEQGAGPSGGGGGLAPNTTTFLEQIVAGASGGDEITERDKVLCLLSHFDHDQLDRYEAFRRGAFPKSVIRMIMQTVSGRVVSQNSVIAMAGITKVYIGEIVEEALRFREQQMGSSKLFHEGEASPEPTEKLKEPLKPSHIYEAVRRLSEKIINQRTPEFRL